MRALLLAAALVFSSSVTVQAAESEVQTAAKVSPQFCMIQSVRSDMGLLSAPIKSRQDLARHIRDGRENGSPLRALSRKGSQRFIASLKFNEEGVTSYRYDVLEKELSVTEAYLVLSLFGLEKELSVTEAYLVLSLFGAQDDIRMLTFARVDTQLDHDLLSVVEVAASCSGNGDYPNMQCARRATCAPMSSHICKASC